MCAREPHFLPFASPVKPTRTATTRETTNAASGPDEAQRRRLNDALRVQGRGGVVTISISLAIAGEEIIEAALRAVASSQGDGDAGATESEVGLLRWQITDSGDASPRVMAVWLAGEEDDRP